jgi:predicted nuclease of predicted toxin-antitoxin system
MRFLVDENLHRDVAEILEANGHDALFIPRGPLRGASDDRLGSIAIDESMIVVTRDVRFALDEALGVAESCFLQFRTGIHVLTSETGFFRLLSIPSFSAWKVT